MVKRTAVLPDAQSAPIARAALDGLRATDDFREGPLAFLEKRVPVWSGR